jgi:hypothetical protein
MPKTSHLLALAMPILQRNFVRSFKPPVQQLTDPFENEKDIAGWRTPLT